MTDRPTLPDGAEPLTSASGRSLPPEIGGYRITGRLSRGGMGEVLLGQRESIGFTKKVAIKIVLPHVAEDEDYRTLFFDEAKLVARMSHPNLTQVFDFGEDNGVLFLVMELIEGLSVEKIFAAHKSRSQRMPPEIAGLICAQAARGLHSAHSLLGDDGRLLHVVHRDVSPQNLIVTYAGSTKVIDFGIARSEDRRGHTQIGVVRGKPGYMAPEQARNEPLDARTDIFQLGIVLYELLTSRELYVSENMYESIARAVEQPVPNVLEVLPDIDPGYNDVVQAALAKAKDQRFSNADAMARALDNVISRCGYPIGESILGDYIRQLHPPPTETEAKTITGVPAEGRDAGRQTRPLEPQAGRPTGKATAAISSGVHDRAPTPQPLPAVTLDDAEAEAARGQPSMKMITAATPLTSSGVETGLAFVARERRRRNLIAAVGLLLAALVIVAGVVFSGGGTGGDGTDPAPETVAVDTPAPEPAATDPSAPGELEDAGAAKPAADTPTAAEDPEPRTRPRRRRVRRREPPVEVAPEPAPPPPEPVKEPDPAPVPEPAPPPAPKTYGFLSVPVDKPYALVKVDGKHVGQSPIVRLKLQTGEHVVELVDPETNSVRKRATIEIRQGKYTKVRD